MPRTYKTTGYKHRQYEDIARILGGAKTWRLVYDEFVRLFAADNPRFDAERFRRAVEQARIHAGYETPCFQRDGAHVSSV